MNLWNQKNLHPPPVLTCKLNVKEVDIKLLNIVVENALKFFQSQQQLETESALLSRTVYRLKMKFRSSKDFKSTEILSRIVRTYINLEFTTTLKQLFKAIPKNYIPNKFYTLTKNLIDFILVRIQGIGKLLCRILETCKQVSLLAEKRLRLGHFWKIAIIILSTTSRIFVLCKNILKYTCDLYKNLKPFSSSLKNSGRQWLPVGYIFPKDLDEWLELQWLELENDIIEIPDDESIFSFMNLTDSDDEDAVEFCDEYLLLNDEIFTGDSPSHTKKAEPSSQDIILLEDSITEKANNTLEEEIDIGEVIDITDSTQKKPKHLKRKLNQEVIEIVDSVKKKKKPKQFKKNTIKINLLNKKKRFKQAQKRKTNSST